jgi:hypothetical protein
MTASLPIPFAIGEIVWCCGNGRIEELATCPECAGTRALTLIQGNGEQVSIACACCSRGYGSPSGYVNRVRHEHRPERFTCARVDVSGDEIRYRDDALACTSREASRLFRSLEECQAACDRENVERAEHDEKMALANLASTRRDMAFSVHYWGRKVRDLERDLERARARLSECKQRKAAP